MHNILLDNAYNICAYYAYRGAVMRTTIDLPESLVAEAMKLTKIKTKTDVIKEALSNLIQREKVKNIKNYQGKIDLNINLDRLRNR
jgi:Arc/MetJ family transcription regulator